MPGLPEGTPLQGAAWQQWRPWQRCHADLQLGALWGVISSSMLSMEIKQGLFEFQEPRWTCDLDLASLGQARDLAQLADPYAWGGE